MLIIVLRHVFSFISAILFIMHNNDVELRLPCQEGALGKLVNLPWMKKWKQCKIRKNKHVIENIETIQISFQFGARMKSKERLPYAQTC